MQFSYNIYKKLKYSKLLLKNPQGTKINILNNIEELKLKMYANSVSELSFKVYEYVNGKYNKLYNLIETMRLIELQYISIFQIKNVKETYEDDSTVMYKSVECMTLENELIGKTIDSIKGVYALYDLTDPEHSLLHIIPKYCGWSVAHVSNELQGKWRTFSIDSEQIYNFLTESVAKSFDCIFSFNTFDKTISAITIEEFGELTDITISNKNLLKTFSKESDLDNIATVMRVRGGTSTDNTIFDIRAVNLDGSDKIVNIDYYKVPFNPITGEGWMSQGLVNALDNYNNACNTYNNQYFSALNLLKQYQVELQTLKNQLIEIENQISAQNQVVGVSVQNHYGRPPLNGETDYIIYQSAITQIGTLTSQKVTKENEITSKNTQISDQQTTLNNINIDVDKTLYFTSEQLKELETFYTQADDYTDDTYQATDTMTQEEIINLKLELKSNAEKELAKVCRPQYTIETTISNLWSIQDKQDSHISFDTWKQKLVTGNLITLKLRDNYHITVRLAIIEFDFDDLEKVKLTFSEKSRLDDKLTQLGELLAQAKSTSKSLSLNMYGYDAAASKTSSFNEFMNGALDATLNKMRSNKHEETIFDQFGLHMKRWDVNTNSYSPYQSWWQADTLMFSDDSFSSAKMAVGKIIAPDGNAYYGLATDVIYGKLMITSSLTISNENNTITMNKDGATFKDCDITIMKGTNVLKLNATDGIKLTNNGVSKFYLDADGNINFTGILSGATGTFSGTITASSFIGGSVVSDNWDYTNNIGTYINLTDAYSIWGGSDTYSWLSQTSVLKKAFVELRYGYIRLRNDTLDRSIYLTSEGFSTQKDANNASGVIDFFSTLYGDTYRGITIQTNNSPLALRSLQNVIMLNPEIDTAQGNLYCVDVADDTADGRLRYGTGVVVDTSRTFAAGIRFSSDPTNPWIAITDGTGAKANLAPILASNIAFPTGGTAGQVLSKVDSTDFNVHWVDMTGGTGGGTSGTTNIWVQDDEPTTAIAKDLWIDTNDYSRYDALRVTANRTLLISDNEVINASGSISITLHSASNVGIIKKIFNIGTGIITLIGTINGLANMYLYPNESVELITDGTGWRW